MYTEQSDARWDVDVEEMNRSAGFGTVDTCMDLATIDGFFGTTLPKFSLLPPCYTNVAYWMRDDPEDEEPQDPRTYHPDHIDSSDADASRTSDFRRERETQMDSEDVCS